jgi:nucleoid DNA-binding protein
LSKVQINAVLEALFDIAVKETKRAGVFNIPNLVKLRTAHKAATAARPGRNPFTGESITIKAKPAKTVVRAKVLKQFKEKAE